MEKILVTTDQSDNSKSALRFAIKLAKERKAELVILHIYHLLKPFNWTDHAFEEYGDNFRKKTITELTSFITKIYHDIHEPEINHQLVLVSNPDVVNGICNMLLCTIVPTSVSVPGAQVYSQKYSAPTPLS